jgi:phosphoesterase RecJ-like protein
VAEFIEYNGGVRAVTSEIATYLFLGVLYDTGCYRNTNTMPSTFERSARLMARGADYAGLIRNLFQSTSVGYARLYGEGLANLVTLADGKAVGTFLSKETFAKHGVDQSALGHEFVNDFLRSVKAEFVFLIKEMPDGERRMSFRSKNPDVDMRTVSGLFGGGGHTMACGAHTRLPLDEILQMIGGFAEMIG